MTEDEIEIPKWSETFKDFPRIPDSKKWIPGELFTYEQYITKKLLDNAGISREEEQQLIEAMDFYKVLDRHLTSFNFDSLNADEIEDFKNYFFYAFNYFALITNDLLIFQTYRLIINENILKKKEKIRDKKYLTYPSIELVKEISKYNRANTPNTNVFYSSESIDTTLLEMKPKIGDLVTIGVWEPEKEGPIMSYPITHSPLAYSANYEVKKGFIAFQKIKANNHPLLISFMENFFTLLSREYAKPVKNHKEYLLSALLSERILGYKKDPKVRFDCIIYPSVESKYTVANVAIKPEVLDSKFKCYN